MHRLIRGVVAAATMLALAIPAATSVAAAGISISPGTGAVGTGATVSGNGFAANTTVRVFFNGSGGTQIGSESSDSSGNLPNLGVTIPNTTGGTYQIFATDGSNTATTTFTVPSNLTLNPSSGGPGTGVNVSGTGFMAGEAVVIGWDQATNQVAAATANGNGAFVAGFSAPSSATGNHTVFATGQSSHFTLSTSFNLNGTSNVGGANISLNPTSGLAGSSVTLTGSGFGANEQVNLTVDGAGVTSVTSDGNGNFSVSLTLSSSLGTGQHTIAANGVSSGHSASATFFVTSQQPPSSSCSSDDDDRPGNGFGDPNHCHTGPPGQEDHGDNNGGGHGHGHGHGHGRHGGGDDNDQGEND